MQVTPGEIEGLVIFTPRVHEDARGFFFESFRQSIFSEATGLNLSFVQDNHSHSRRGVLRGLHYQLSPAPQGKLVRVVRGEIFDVAVDVRQGSPSFGRWQGVRLSAENKKQFWLPPGFAHGFLTLSAEAEVLYKTTEYWAAECERCIRWDDAQIAIAWPLEAIGGAPQLAPKDEAGARLQDCERFVA